MKKRMKVTAAALVAVFLLSAGLLPTIQAKAMDEDDINAAYTALKAAHEGERVTVWADQVTGIPTKLLTAIKGRNVTMVFEMIDYRWEVNGLSVGKLDPNIDNYYLKIKPAEEQLPEVDSGSLVMQFQTVYQGKLPFEASLTLPVGSKYGKKLLLFYEFDKAANKVNFIGAAPVKGSNITLPYENGGFFALTTKWVGPYPDLYYDITNHWARGNISLVSAMKVFLGTGERTFSPEGTITRGMFVTLLGRLYGAPTSLTSGFSDVAPADYWAPYIGWAKGAGIVMGTGPDTFSPVDPITREQAAVILENFLTKGFGYPKGTGGEPPYTDAQIISPWAKDSVLHLSQLGILKGTGDGAFAPTQMMTRAEGAAVLSRMITGVLAAQ